MSGWMSLDSQSTGSNFAYAFVFYARRVFLSFWGYFIMQRLIYIVIHEVVTSFSW